MIVVCCKSKSWNTVGAPRLTWYRLSCKFNWWPSQCLRRRLCFFLFLRAGVQWENAVQSKGFRPLQWSAPPIWNLHCRSLVDSIWINYTSPFSSMDNEHKWIITKWRGRRLEPSTRHSRGIMLFSSTVENCDDIVDSFIVQTENANTIQCSSLMNQKLTHDL